MLSFFGISKLARVIGTRRYFIYHQLADGPVQQVHSTVFSASSRVLRLPQAEERFGRLQGMVYLGMYMKLIYQFSGKLYRNFHGCLIDYLLNQPKAISLFVL